VNNNPWECRPESGSHIPIVDEEEDIPIAEETIPCYVTEHQQLDYLWPTGIVINITILSSAHISTPGTKNTRLRAC
jgi:hypothetical protein